jgi:hypothetical protein
MLVTVRFRKDDPSGKGHFPRIGWAKTQQYDIVARLKSYILNFGLHNSPACTKKSTPKERCAHCYPLFPRTSQLGGTSTTTMKAQTPSRFSSSLSALAASIGLDRTRFSGKSR